MATKAKKPKRRASSEVLSELYAAQGYTPYYEVLPFIERKPKRGTPRNFWTPPYTDNYGDACDMGKRYFWDTVHHLKQNPHDAGCSFMLDIAEGMAKLGRGGKNGCMHGYAVGFFAEMERFLRDADKYIRVRDSGSVYGFNGERQ